MNSEIQITKPLKEEKFGAKSVTLMMHRPGRNWSKSKQRKHLHSNRMCLHRFFKGNTQAFKSLIMWVRENGYNQPPEKLLRRGVLSEYNYDPSWAREQLAYLRRKPNRILERAEG